MLIVVHNELLAPFLMMLVRTLQLPRAYGCRRPIGVRWPFIQYQYGFGEGRVCTLAQNFVRVFPRIESGLS